MVLEPNPRPNVKPNLSCLDTAYQMWRKPPIDSAANAVGLQFF